ncbi:MAG: universal stress protein [Candidatus Binataceae bacterium]
MAFPFRKILCPIDFDDNSMAALDAAANLSRQNDGAVFVLHVVPMIIPPAGMPAYVDLFKGQEEAAHAKLTDIARRRLAGLKYELLTGSGEPAQSILRVARKVGADLLVMATHGRRGFSHFFLGSVAELVLRESPCPVLTVKFTPPHKELVGAWMTKNPVTAAPDEKLSSVEAKMRDGGFRSVPIVKDGAVIGIVTDRDLRRHSGTLDSTLVNAAMSEPLITVTPGTTVREAARLLRERKIGGLPVVEDGKLAGIFTASGILEALGAEE